MAGAARAAGQIWYSTYPDFLSIAKDHAHLVLEVEYEDSQGSLPHLTRQFAIIEPTSGKYMLIFEKIFFGYSEIQKRCLNNNIRFRVAVKSEAEATVNSITWNIFRERHRRSPSSSPACELGYSTFFYQEDLDQQKKDKELAAIDDKGEKSDKNCPIL